MTPTNILLIIIIAFSLFSLFAINIIIPVYATTAAPSNEQQLKPGTLIIITFENGTTKAIHSDSTNLRAVQGGFFIADSSVKASQPIQSKTVSNTVVQQLVSVVVDVSIDELPPQSPIAPEPQGGACAALYTFNPETGQCELPPNQSPLDSEPQEQDLASEPEPEPESPSPENDSGGNGNSNEEGDGGSGNGDSGDGGEGNGAEGDDDGGEID